MKTVIKITNLCKNYGESRGIVDINLEVYEGEIFGFVGPNGSGKSTTIRTMLNFIYKTSGSINILGYDSVTESPLIKKEIGYVSSEVSFYDYMTTYDLLKYSISFYKDIDDKRIEELCREFELDMHKKIRELSLGNKKKVSLIQAIIHNPKLIILDEPTSGLDPLMQKKLFEILKKMKATVFLSSHNLAEVEKYCDRVAIVKEGLVVDVKKISEININLTKHIIIKTNRKLILKTKGISDINYKEKELSFTFDGNIQELLKEISEYEIKDISILPRSLEESILEYYGR